MGKMASKVTKRIMASVLTVAMILSNMTVYASEYSEPAQQTEETVENSETGAAELPSTDDETVPDEGAQDEGTTDGTTQDEGNTAQDEETTPGDDSDPTEKVDGDEEPAQDGTDENVPGEEEPGAEAVSADIEDEEPNKNEGGTHTLWIVGDSTVCGYDPLDDYYYPRYGYGTQIQQYLDSTYVVENLAASGTSSKSFMSNSNYAKLTNAETGIQSGDTLVIGFGHNDEKAEEARYTNPNGTYTDNGSFAKSLYDNYVKIAKERGAEVILCTPIVRRNTNVDDNGKTKLSDSNKHITSTSGNYPGGDYRLAIENLGKAVKVPVVDLTTLTTDLYESMTPEETAYFHAWTAGVGGDNDPGDPTSADNTHLNVYGAKTVAWMFVNAINDAEIDATNEDANDSLLAKTALAAHLDLDTVGAPDKTKDLVKKPDYVKPPYESPTTGSTNWTDYVASDSASRSITFKGTAFGQLGMTSATESNLKNNFKLETDTDGNMHIVASNNKGKITSDEDGFVMYYYRLPVGSQFEFSAKAKVTSIPTGDSQVAFGLIARDDMYIDNATSVKSDYVAAGSLGKGSNCFYRRSGTLKSGPALSTETLAAGTSYDLQIVTNSDGYACTFGRETTQSDGFDFALATVDTQYIYIGMFATRNADVTYSNIYLKVGNDVLIDQRKTECAITVTNDGNGTAIASDAKAAKDSVITLTATPKDDYVLDHWEVTDESGAAINVTNNQFKMPALDVTVKAVFAELNFAEASVAAGTKDFTPKSGVGLTDFEGITFSNITPSDTGHGFYTEKFSKNPIINLHMEEGRKASITVLACCYGAGSSGNNSLKSSAGVVTERTLEEETGKNGTQFDVLNVAEEYVTLTLGNDMWIHNIMVAYEQEVSGPRKIDVWDFGAKQETNTELYNNNITTIDWLTHKSKIGSDGKFSATGDFTFGDVTIKGVQTNDRLYSNETGLSGVMSAGANYAGKSVAGDNDNYASSGAYYCNGTGGKARRLLEISNVQAGDKIVLYIGSSNGSDVAHFAGQGAASDQDDTFELSQSIQKHEFVAEYSGTYMIHTTNTATGYAKPVYYRVMRIPAVKVSGTINYNGIELPEGYSLLLVNQTTNGETVAELGENEEGEPAFTAYLAPGYTYKAALTGATGYGFTNESAIFTVEKEQIFTGKNDVALVLEEKDTFDYSGKIKGFAANYAKLDDLKIILTPPATSSDDKIELDIDKTDKSNLTFNATLAPDVEYSLVMEGVNDYEIIAPTVVKKAADETGTSHENRTISVRERAKYDVSGGFMGLSGSAEVTALTFTNVADNYVYNATINSDKDGYSIELRDGEYLAKATITDYSTKTHVVVKGGSVSKDLMFVSTKAKSQIDKADDIYVGYPDKTNNYATVSEAMEACELMKRNATTPERVTVHIAPGTYREQIIVNAPNVSFVNDSKNGEEVLLTWYYGIGYKYYSSNGYYDAERAYDKYEKKIADKWGTAVYVKSTATGFRAEGITFENSFNRYVTEEEIADGVEADTISFVRNLRSDVTSKAATERATAICVEANQSEFKDCAFYSSQDTLYTAANCYFKNCIIEGQTDYIFGSGNCVFDSCELSWKGYSIGSQGGYITANRPSTGDLGYLFRNCTVTANAHNDLEVVAGYWGRPWGAGAPVKFMNTKLQTASLIVNAGWTEMSGVQPTQANFREYKTTAMDGTTVNTSGRVAGTIMSDADAEAVDVKTYFGSWAPNTPVYFTDDSDTTVEIQGDLTLSDNGDINYLLPGHTLTVGYTLNSDANNANDASVVKWYTVQYAADGTAGTPKLVKTANGAIDKTYKVSKTDIGSYIKVTVTPGTVSGKTGTMKELTLYKDADYDHVVNDGYYDPTTGSSSSLGDGVNIFLAGDSTTKDYSENGLYQSGKASNLGSWGEFLQCFFDESEVKIQNYANGGRSTRSFINEGSFDKIKDQIGAGDYLFIQFAHNDSSAIASKKDVYVPLGEPTNGIYPYTAGTPVNGKYPDYAVSAGSSAADNGTATYKWFLKQYVDMALDAGATPVLLTPVARMYVDDKTGAMKDHHKDEGSVAQEAFGYCKAVKQVYDDYVKDGKKVLYIDAYTLTANFYTEAWKPVSNNTNNNQVMCIGDATHSNKLGGMLTAAAYAQELQKMNISIAEAVKAPSNVSALTVADVSNGITAGNAVFSIDANGNLTAYDLTKNCSARATYWEGIGTTILTAIKTKADELGSATADGAVETPTATLSDEPDEDGNVESGTTVTLGCTTTGATIYYTTDGSNPKVSQTREEYVDGTTEIAITEDITIKAYAVKEGMSDSKIAVFSYTMAPLVKAPTANPVSGTVKSGTKIELETATETEGVQIRYTMGTNPADPTKYSTRYNSTTGIIIKTDTTIKAIAVLGDNISEISTFTYTIDTTASTVKPATPTSNKANGAVNIGEVIELSTATEGAMIYYTVGSDPAEPTTLNADLYDADDKITINSSVKIKAVAIKDDVSSDVAIFSYTVPTTPAPSFTPGEGEISVGGTVTLKVEAETGTTLSGVKIYYTTDRSNPKTSDTRTPVDGDTATIPINADTTIKAYATSTGMADSEVITCKYTLEATPEPTVSPEPTGPVNVGTEVTLSVTAKEGATLTGVKLHYTTDKSNPKNSETTQHVDGATAKIVINDDMTIRAYAESTGLKDSDLVRFEYSVKTAEAPTADPEPVADQNVKKGTTVKLSSATEDAEIWYTTKSGTNVTEISKEALDTKFSADITIREDTVIYAYAKAEGFKDSEIKTFVYTVASTGSTVTDDKAGIEIVGLKEEYDYTGAKITPDFSVVDNGIKEDGEPRVLTVGIDYTVKYANNNKVTTPAKPATVTVVGKGNYAGKEVTGSFQIIEVAKVTGDALADLKGTKFVGKIAARNYTGEAFYPEFKLKIKSENNKEVTYKYNSATKQYDRTDGGMMNINVALSNNVNKGTATILVTGKLGTNKKATSVKTTFKINPVDLSQATAEQLSVIVADGDASVPYAVKGATPSIEVSYKFSADNEVDLVNGKDYTVKYSANKKVGTGTFTITGKGNYTKKYKGTTGKGTSTFTIDKLDMADTELVAVNAYDGLKAVSVKATVVDEKHDTLKASQYTVEVFEDSNCQTQITDKKAKLTAGQTIYVRAKAKDTKNLKENSTTTPVAFTVGQNIAKAKFTLQFKTKGYTGAEIELDPATDLKVTIKEKGKKEPTVLNPKDGENGDYEIVSYSNNINKGTATVVIKGIGSYSGTKTIKFKIAAKAMKKHTTTTP